MKLWQLKLALEPFTDDCEVRIVSSSKRAEFDVESNGCRSIAFSVDYNDLTDEDEIENLKEHLGEREEVISTLRKQVAALTDGQKLNVGALFNAVDHALRLSKAGLLDLRQAGNLEGGMAIAGELANIKLFEDALSSCAEVINPAIVNKT